MDKINEDETLKKYLSIAVVIALVANLSVCGTLIWGIVNLAVCHGV